MKRHRKKKIRRTRWLLLDPRVIQTQQARRVAGIDVVEMLLSPLLCFSQESIKTYPPIFRRSPLNAQGYGIVTKMENSHSFTFPAVYMLETPELLGSTTLSERLMRS